MRTNRQNAARSASVKPPACRGGRARGGAPPEGRARIVIPSAAVILLLGGCSAAEHRRQADEAAYRVIVTKQEQALGRTEPFTIQTPAQTLRRRLMLDQGLLWSTGASLGSHDVEPIPQWPDRAYLERPDDAEPVRGTFDTDNRLRVSLLDALQIAAHGSREYQAQKEQVFEAALQLDLESDAFRRTWTGVLDAMYQAQLEREVALDDKGHTDRQTVGGMEYGGTLGLSQRFRNGLSFTGQIGLDLASMLTQDRLFSRGIFADVSITAPLLRGSGTFVVTEPLTQADRNVVYALYTFEQFKRQFVVDVASEYFAVLRQLDTVDNTEGNYKRLIESTRRARRMADAGRLSEVQVDQSRQNELRARNQWISAEQSYRRQLDGFKLTLGLPTDAEIVLDRGELDRVRDAVQRLTAGTLEDEAEGEPPPAGEPVTLVRPGLGPRGPYELDATQAILLALTHRPDLRTAVGRVHDSQRVVAIAADRLRADVTLLGSGAAGARRALSSAGLDDAILRPDEGVYSALLTIDLPFERTAERNVYRSSLIRFEQAVRNVQALEDQIKLDVRNGLSRLMEARESAMIQAEAVKVAERRVESTRLFMEAGRAEIRDVLEAEDALVNAMNALTAAMVSYRINELALQRDLGVLTVDHRGLLHEYTPENGTDGHDNDTGNNENES